MKKFLVIIILILAAVLPTMAQSNNDVQLAYSYYNNKEYDKASYLFEDLFNKSKSRSYFNYYINCLLRTDQFEKAEKAAKKQASASKHDACYRIILGNVYKQMQKLDKALAEYDDVISSLRPDRNSIIQATNQFLTFNENEYAEKTLLKAREITGESYNNELFSVYASSRNFKMMAQTGLDIVDNDPSQIFSVENMYQYYINNDINDEFYNILRTTLLQRIQQKPSTHYSEMMIWLMVQRKNFKGAIVQAKALDKRLGESGQRLIMIGDQALQAKDYSAAADAYKYVLSKGKDSPYHQRATFGTLTSMYQQIDNGTITDIEQIKFLESQYTATFQEFGYNSRTVPEIRNFARIETYYLNKPDSARAIIGRALKAQGVNYTTKATLNLELGDIQFYEGDVWDALMTYAKVENDNKQNEYGDEAKFRKARVAYYTGNFKWAASQLDVLKAATTKLVANDAMELSLLIADNAERENSVPGDTTALISENQQSSPDLRIYARADMYRHQNQLDRAVLSIDSIITVHKTSPLVDEAYFMKANIFLKQRNYDTAAVFYKKVADDYAYDILADKACFSYAKLAEQHLSDIAAAKEYYMRILTDYPGSVYAVESRERYRALESVQ
ncbi:MAG: tetratricopeptide repeat protein [Bacteroidales bacterium]|nr:tetratricopeptide repeat protein [Bacteroidales bacterium]